MKPQNLNEQIDRILKLSDYSVTPTKRALVEMNVPMEEAQPAPAAAAPQQAAPPAQGQPQQQAPQVNPQQADAAFEREVDSALGQILKDLPNQLKQIATTQGDRDGQLEPVGQQNQNQQQQQQAAPAQGQPQAQQQSVAESELNEAIGALVAGTALALPAIGNLVGKGISYLGKKLDSQATQEAGEKVSHIAEHLHHKYQDMIKGILSPYIGTLLPKQQQTVVNGVFYALVAALGAAGFAGAAHAAHGGNIGLASLEGGLTTVKASELLNAAKGIIPKILTSVVA